MKVDFPPSKLEVRHESRDARGRVWNRAFSNLRVLPAVMPALFCARLPRVDRHSGRGASGRRSTCIARRRTGRWCCIRPWPGCSACRCGSRPASAPGSGWRCTASTTRSPMRKAIRTARRSMGFWSVQLGNVFHYVREAKKPRGRRALRARHRGGRLGSRVLQPRVAGLVDRARRCSVLVLGLGVGAARGGHPRRDVRVRAVLVHQRPVPPRRLQELRQHRDQPAAARARHRR